MPVVAPAMLDNPEHCRYLLRGNTLHHMQCLPIQARPLELMYK